MSRRGILVALATVGLVVISACKPDPSVRLEIEIVGGFAFVPTPQKTLEVAYLNKVEMDDCSVTPVGTHLIVVRGDIAGGDPAPEDLIFDLNGLVVTFPGLDKLKLTNGLRTKGMPSPRFPGLKGKWKSSKYVPGIKFHHDKSRIKEDWQKLVNGRMVLRGGKIEGAPPSDPLMLDAKFDFQLAGTSIGKAAVTDRMIYTVDVPGEEVEIVFTNRRDESKRLVLKPWAKDKPVRLLLRGLHDTPMTGALGSSIELKDFCAFYSLLEGGEAIPSTKRLKLFYEPAQQVASTAPQNNNGQNIATNRPQPSPGFYCGGDWF